MVSPVEGKTELFSEKSDQKGSQNRVSVYHSLVGDIEVFHHFQGFLKIQVEMTGAGKGGEAGASVCGKNHYNLLQTGRQTLAI